MFNKVEIKIKTSIFSKLMKKKNNAFIGISQQFHFDENPVNEGHHLLGVDEESSD